MTDLETQLVELGEHLAIDDKRLADDVLDQLRSRRQHTPWLRAAAVIALVVAAIIALPDTRHAVADWFGFGAVTIERLPDDAIERAEASFDLAGPGNSVIEVVDGREILVSQFDARLSVPLLSKSIGVSTSVVAVEVAGAAGVWIDDGPHEVFYETGDGVGQARTAGRTLLWQSGDLVFRVEGFPDLESALKYGSALTPSTD